VFFRAVRTPKNWFLHNFNHFVYLGAQHGLNFLKFRAAISKKASRSLEFIVRNSPKIIQLVSRVQSSKKSQIMSKCGTSNWLCTMFRTPCGNSTMMKTTMTARIIFVVRLCCLFLSALANRADMSLIAFSCLRINIDIRKRTKQGANLQIILNHQKLILCRFSFVEKDRWKTVWLACCGYFSMQCGSGDSALLTFEWK
jgi:hypothetical protein